MLARVVRQTVGIPVGIVCATLLPIYFYIHVRPGLPESFFVEERGLAQSFDYNSVI